VVSLAPIGDNEGKRDLPCTLNRRAAADSAFSRLTLVNVIDDSWVITRTCAISRMMFGQKNCSPPKSAVSLVRDLAAMRSLQPSPFDACDQANAPVRPQSLVRCKTNDYSVPVAFGHQDV